MSSPMQNKPTNIQSVLRSYGGPSLQSTEHKDQLKQQLLRSEFFTEAEPATEADTTESQGVVFSWASLTRRLSLAAAPALAFVLILAIVVANYAPVTAKQVLAKAADQLESSAGEGRVSYTKQHVTTYFNGVTDTFNDLISEMWIDSESTKSRSRLTTPDGQLFEEVVQTPTEFYQCENCLAREVSEGAIVEGPIVQPDGPVAKLLAELDEPSEVPTTGGGLIAYGGGVEAQTSSACAEGAEDCQDVVSIEVPPGCEQGCGGGGQIDFNAAYLDFYKQLGFVGAIPGETDEEIIGSLYGLQSVTDPSARAKVLRDLSDSPRVSITDKQEWHGHNVYVVSVTYWQSTQRDVFYIDRDSYEFVGMETTYTGGIGPSGVEQRVVVELLEAGSTDDVTTVEAGELKKTNIFEQYGLPIDATNIEIEYIPTNPDEAVQP